MKNRNLQGLQELAGFTINGIKLRLKTVYFPSSQEGIKGWCLNKFPLKTNKYKMKKNHFLPPPPNPLLKCQ
jgi:hypothetical protein